MAKATAELKLNPDALNKFYAHPKVIAELERRGGKIRDAAGSEEDYRLDMVIPEGNDKINRPYVFVGTLTYKARAEAIENMTLERAIDAGR